MADFLGVQGGVNNLLTFPKVPQYTLRLNFQEPHNFLTDLQQIKNDFVKFLHPYILLGSAPGSWALQYMNMFSNQSQDKYVHPALT